MEFVKYFVNPTFDKESFVELLRLRMNVKAKAVDDGIILDRKAFNEVRPAQMPHWAYINRKFINSDFHTRPAAPAEWPDLNPKRRYSLTMLAEGSNTTLEVGDGLEYMTEQADMCAECWQNSDIFGIAVIDNETGEVVYIHEVGE